MKSFFPCSDQFISVLKVKQVCNDSLGMLHWVQSNKRLITQCSSVNHYILIVCQLNRDEMIILTHCVTLCLLLESTYGVFSIWWHKSIQLSFYFCYSLKVKKDKMIFVSTYVTKQKAFTVSSTSLARKHSIVNELIVLSSSQVTKTNVIGRHPWEMAWAWFLILHVDQLSAKVRRSNSFGEGNAALLQLLSDIRVFVLLEAPTTKICLVVDLAELTSSWLETSVPSNPFSANACEYLVLVIGSIAAMTKTRENGLSVQRDAFPNETSAIDFADVRSSATRCGHLGRKRRTIYVTKRDENKGPNAMCIMRTRIFCPRRTWVT